jgi:acetyltransferase-like isoleucine patch superfamily enzyme
LVLCSTSIKILPRSQIGQSVVIADGNHRFRDWQKHMNEQGYDYKPLTIGPQANIYGNSTIVASIGERAVVAANSVVIKDVPAYCLVGGAPARIIEYFGPEELRPPGLDA